MTIVQDYFSHTETFAGNIRRRSVEHLGRYISSAMVVMFDQVEGIAC